MSFKTKISDTHTELALDLPPLNALDLNAVNALADWFEGYDQRAPLILTGMGRAFCAGVDTGAFTAYSQGERAQLFNAITRMTGALYALPGPVIAAINGHAIGGGLVLALCADYRIVAAGSHKFGLTEAKAGVPFPEGPQLIIRHEVPSALLRHLALSSRLVSAERLADWKVFDVITAPETLIEEARAQAKLLGDQPAFCEVKQQIRGDLATKLRGLLPTQAKP